MFHPLRALADLIRNLLPRIACGGRNLAPKVRPKFCFQGPEPSNLSPSLLRRAAPAGGAPARRRRKRGAPLVSANIGTLSGADMHEWHVSESQASSTSALLHLLPKPVLSLSKDSTLRRSHSIQGGFGMFSVAWCKYRAQRSERSSK